MSPHNVGVRDPLDVVQHLREFPAPPARIGLADRISLRLGLWLLLRAVGRDRTAVRERNVRAHRAARERAQRALHHQRLLLNRPPL